MGSDVCPYCGASAEDAESLLSPKSVPSPDDAMVCAYCAGVSVYDNDLRPRRLGERERDVLDSPVVKRAVRATLENPGNWRAITRAARRIGES